MRVRRVRRGARHGICFRLVASETKTSTVSKLELNDEQKQPEARGTESMFWTSTQSFRTGCGPIFTSPMVISRRECVRWRAVFAQH